jgi:CRP/FNR family cyclic AMP-dependent transcriptional regulator
MCPANSRELQEMTMLDLTILFGRDRNATDFTAGEYIFREGDDSREMYAVLRGQVDIILGDRVLETVSPGGLFGEMALIDPAPRSADAVARSDCRIVPIDNRQFQLQVQQTPYFAIHVMRVQADRLRRQTHLDDDAPNTD